MIDLSARARMLSCAPKGILAADESKVTAEKRLASCGIKVTDETRRQYRQLFLGASDIDQYLNGVILFTDSLKEKDSSGKTFPELLHERNIMVGVKVDLGTEPFDESGEVITKGLVGLQERLHEYASVYHAEFTKWRAVIQIQGDKLPTNGAILENARRLASFARLSQEAGLVPMVEPEVLYDGKHSLLQSRDTIKKTLDIVVDALRENAVDLSAVVIKTSMALSGRDTGRMDTPEEVAKETMYALRASVPEEIAGVVFLSGGQDDDQATENLKAIHTLTSKEQAPWNITFSYSRAIEEEALRAWQCKVENEAFAREAYLLRLKKLAEAFGNKESICIEL